MKALNCENVLLAMMAAADGEKAQLSPEEIKEHLNACEECRYEVVRTQRFSDILRQASRAESNLDLWPTISRRLDQQASTVSWQPYVVVGVLLLVYKLFELLPTHRPGWAITLVPLIIFGALFVFLRENPFKINSELVMEK